MILRWIREQFTPSVNLKLLNAFPSSLRDEALSAIAILPEPSYRPLSAFTVRVNAESIAIPYRESYDPARIVSKRLSPTQKPFLDAILTRHNDGHVRQHHLSGILGLNQPWVAPFIVQLVGEYVVEIIEEIDRHIEKLDGDLYGTFLRENPEFLRLTEQRVISYWDCYYRNQRKEYYAGFRVLRFFRECLAKT